MHESVVSYFRIALPAMLAIVSLDSVALAADSHTHSPTSKVAAPAAQQFEIRFLEGMIDHHAMAVHMSQMLQTQAVHPELRKLGDSIAVAQKAEIIQMQGWLVKWYGRKHEPSMMMMPSMQKLERLKATAFEQEYLSMMIRHHAMAVKQAKECERLAKHSELHVLCHNIDRSQRGEIAVMKDWLCRWYRKCN